MSVSKVENCYGCEACANVCSRKAIVFHEDEQGFLYPKVDNSMCVECKVCEQFCPSLKKPTKKTGEKKYYGAYSNDDNELKHSTSGGIAYELMKYYINNYKIVYGVAYSDDYKYAHFKRANKETEIKRLQGTKYVQAKKENVFLDVYNDLKEQEDVLFIGTPCEIAALKQFLRFKKIVEKNIMFCELVCSGPTSNKVLRQYIQLIEKNNKKKIVYFNMRDKAKGWGSKNIKIEFENGKIISRGLYQTCLGVAFYSMARKSCYSCDYKLKNSLSDLTIGDFWGVNENDGIYNRDGLSLVITHNEKAEELLKKINIKKQEITFEEAVKNNDEIMYSRKSHRTDETFCRAYSKKGLQYANFKNKPILSKIKSLLMYSVRKEGWYE